MIVGSHVCHIEWYHFWWSWETPSPGFKVTVYLQVEYLKNGAFKGQVYQRTLIGNHKRSTEWCHFQWPWAISDPDFKVTTFLDIVTIERQQEVICALSNGDISNDFDGPITRFSRPWHFCSQISQKRCILGTKLLKNTNRRPYTIYRLIPLSMTFDPFQGHDIFWSRIS